MGWLHGLAPRRTCGRAPSRALADPSELLKHECAYCLGQMQDSRAVPALCRVLADPGQEAMVRHEAAEALGAIGEQSAGELLRRFAADPAREVAETCQLALGRLAWLRGEEAAGGFRTGNPYDSVDPAPSCSGGSVAEWRADLLNPSLPLFQRYRAMFSLRNTGGEAAVGALLAGLADNSALFKHEVAYVLGQMRDARAVGGLRARLEDARENAMVRHESAEALGSIASAECLDVIGQFVQDGEGVVRESCEVALDMYRHQHSGRFQYADTLATATTSH